MECNFEAGDSMIKAGETDDVLHVLVSGVARQVTRTFDLPLLCSHILIYSPLYGYIALCMDTTVGPCIAHCMDPTVGLCLGP